ncbi:MAG: ATP-dependent DNA ligase [Verrucomicrobiota bacterium JB022]|nr:ATP-dependent DNA ligase [Verrucomicrobiota bacterium JB022]
MRRFTQLFIELDASNKTNEKVRALREYFQSAPPEDAAWTLWFLIGKRFPALVKSARLREWTSDLSGYPDWLVAECYERVGDGAETVALLLPEAHPEGLEEPLHDVVQERLLALRDWDDLVQFQLLRETWAQLDRRQLFVFNKMLTGAFRVGVSRSLVIRGVAEAAELDRGTVAHRLMGDWQPSPEFFQRLIAKGETDEDASRPYPFYLASPTDQPTTELGERAQWQVEWKWDGIRAQLIKRHGQLYLWSRGDELVTEAYPEVIQAAARLPNGTVLDGELLCWREGRPLGFNAMQTRISRKQLPERILRDCPVSFLAYDCLEDGGDDIRPLPLRERRARLERIVGRLHAGERLLTSEVVDAPDWETLEQRWQESRQRGVEGFMLKGLDSPYESGRVRGQWWKWKVAPYTADLVMIYAQAGHGRRASLFTDYTLAAWDGDELVPVAKAYSGLTDAEIREVDRWVKQHTLAKRGPVRTVPAHHVFEIAFEGIRASTRHKSGIAFRFPRIHRWRQDKKPADAEQLETLKALLLEDGGLPTEQNGEVASGPLQQEML